MTEQFWRMITAVLLCAALLSATLLSACAADDDDDDSAGDDDQADDDDGPGAPQTGDSEVLPEFFQDRPWLQDRSLWSMRIDAANPPLLRQIAELGLGNGHVFSLLSANDPLNSLHNLSGPDYQKETRWFSDKGVRLLLDGAQPEYLSQTAWRVRRTAIDITRTDFGSVRLWTVDFAPLLLSAEKNTGEPLDAIVRICVVHNLGRGTIREARLELSSFISEAEGSMLVERNEGEDLYLAHPARQGWTEGDRRLLLPVPELAPGGEAVLPVALAFVREDETPDAIFNQVLEATPEGLLEQTRDSWYAWSEQGARVSTSDQHFDDLLEGLQVTIRVQQTDTGASAVMSEYSSTWIRDIIGPVLLYTPLGRSADAEAMLDYFWGGALLRGNIANAMRVDMDLSELPPQPDWDALPTMTGRTGAETPSYIVLQYRELYRATGDFSRISERYGLIKHCILHQDFRNGCLLPFSDDETYRLVMQAAYGMWIGDSMYDTHLSSNSSFLFVPAAEFAAEVADRLGEEADAAQFRALAQDVRECAEQYYWVDDPDGGYYASIIDIDTLDPWLQPYEDVATQPLWMGYAEPGDERAEQSVLTLIDWFGREDGTVISPADPMYTLLMDLLNIKQGIYTGMAEAYVLDNLTRMDHPRAEQLFLTSQEVFSATGNVTEVQVADDHARFAYLWEPFGFVCDLTSRYRPWEGGIYGRALLDYLFGYRPDAPQERAALTIHLPQSWDQAAVQGLTFGQGSLDVDVSEAAGVREVNVTAHATALALDLAVSINGTIDSLRIDGQDRDLNDYSIAERWGVQRITIPAIALAEDSHVQVEVSYR